MSVVNLLRNRLSRLSIKQWAVLIVLAALAASLVIYLVRRDINIELGEQAARLQAIARINTTVKPGTRLTIDGLQLVLEAREARSLCRYLDSYYVATAGGLLAFDDNGQLRAHYTIVDGLPSLDLVALAVFRGKLYLGSADRGLIAFDGREFTHYQFQQPVIHHISTLLVAGEQLLIGSFDGGLISFDGADFTRRDEPDKPIPQITALLMHQERLYVGTYSAGLYLWQEGRWRQLSKTDGLPSNRVTALLGDEQGAIITTDFGISLLTTSGQLQLVNRLPNITSLVRAAGRLWAGLFTGGVQEILFTGAGNNLANNTPLVGETSEQWRARGSTQLWVEGDNSLYALTREGVLRADLSRTRLEFKPFSALPPAAPLTAAYISALTLDGQGRLWVGYFDRGIDIFNPETMELLTHLEDQSLREINYILADPTQSRMLVATAAGLAIVDQQLRYRLIDERAGISSNAVAHVSILAGKDKENQLALATGRGLTLLQGAIARTPISLPNNYLYTLASMDRRLFVGSLGGLIELEGLRTVRTFTMANSKLSHNWINALLAIDGTLYIGTNGGGIDALLPSGELINFAPQLGKFDVNPNAMYRDARWLFVGTLGNGVYLMDLNSRQWQQFIKGLPSLNVSAITSDERFIYFGTSNGIARYQRSQLNL
ncbi:MAG: hypothetical protein AB1489_05995 [Acidobacteriota bacterium]